MQKKDPLYELRNHKWKPRAESNSQRASPTASSATSSPAGPTCQSYAPHPTTKTTKIMKTIIIITEKSKIETNSSLSLSPSRFVAPFLSSADSRSEAAIFRLPTDRILPPALGPATAAPRAPNCTARRPVSCLVAPPPPMPVARRTAAPPPPPRCDTGAGHDLGC